MVMGAVLLTFEKSLFKSVSHEYMIRTCVLYSTAVRGAGSNSTRNSTARAICSCIRRV